MPKMKTKSGAAKRLKVRGSGTLKRTMAGKSSRCASTWGYCRSKAPAGPTGNGRTAARAGTPPAARS